MARYAVGVDIGGTNIVVGIVDSKGSLLIKNSFSTDSRQPFEAIIKDIAETVLFSLEQANVKNTDIAGTGFGPRNRYARGFIFHRRKPVLRAYGALSVHGQEFYGNYPKAYQ